MWSSRRLAWLALALILAACQAEPVAPSLAAPQIWRVNATPALQWLTPALNQCAQALPNRGINFAELPAANLQESSPDVALLWGAPEKLDQSAYQLGTDRLAIIVNEQNPVRRLAQGNIARIFSGEAATWAEVFPQDCPDCLKLPEGEIQVWVYPPGDDVQESFNSIFKSSAVSSAAFLASSPADVLKAVAEEPTAIGLVPAAWLRNASVAEIEITDIQALALTRPYLAITPQKPDADLSAWLACLSKAVPAP